MKKSLIAMLAVILTIAIFVSCAINPPVYELRFTGTTIKNVDPATSAESDYATKVYTYGSANSVVPTTVVTKYKDGTTMGTEAYTLNSSNLPTEMIQTGYTYDDVNDTYTTTVDSKSKSSIIVDPTSYLMTGFTSYEYDSTFTNTAKAMDTSMTYNTDGKLTDLSYTIYDTTTGAKTAEMGFVVLIPGATTKVGRFEDLSVFNLPLFSTSTKTYTAGALTASITTTLVDGLPTQTDMTMSGMTVSTYIKTTKDSSNRLSTIEYFMDATYLVHASSPKEVYTYDSNGLLSKTEYYSFNTGTNAYETYPRIVKNYSWTNSPISGILGGVVKVKLETGDGATAPISGNYESVDWTETSFVKHAFTKQSDNTYKETQKSTSTLEKIELKK